jgi:hypothetical protein
MAKHRLKFEHIKQPVLPGRRFAFRLATHGGIAVGFLLLSLALGMAGYHYFCDLGWMDAYLNACMILTGMGPVNVMQSTGAKFFSGLYALFSGIAFLTAMSLIFAPVLHRILHKFYVGD